MENQIKKKWTVFFLIGFVDEFVIEMNNMLTDLLSVKKRDEVDIVLCINIKVDKIPPGFQRGKMTSSKKFTTLFYNIAPDGDGKNFLNLLCENDEFEIRRQADVTNFFKETILTQFLADDYILFTWDHGQPLGIFPHKDDPQVPSQESQALAILANRNQLFKPLLLHFRLFELSSRLQDLPLKNKDRLPSPVQLQDDDLQMLTITELRNAIEWAFGKKKIAMVVMMNCYLQFFDTGYELCNNVNYLVAFETEMNFRNGLDYETLFGMLSDNPDIPPATLAKLAVSTYAIKNSKDTAGLAATALFANDLSWYPGLAKLIDEFARNLTRELPRYLAQIQSALAKCKYITPNIPDYCLVDFKNFITCLYSEAPGLFPGALYDLMNLYLDKTVLESFKGASFYREGEDQFISPSAFSVYFPATARMFKSSFLADFMREDSLSPTEFVQDFYWENFIESFVFIQESH